MFVTLDSINNILILVIWVEAAGTETKNNERCLFFLMSFVLAINTFAFMHSNIADKFFIYVCMMLYRCQLKFFSSRMHKSNDDTNSFHISPLASITRLTSKCLDTMRKKLKKDFVLASIFLVHSLAYDEIIAEVAGCWVGVAFST